MTEFRPRVSVPPNSRVGMRFGTDLDHVVADLAQLVLARHDFHPAMVEAVRLRCAAVHDCRACLSLRSTEVLRSEPATDALVDVALRFTDSMLSTPVFLDDDLRRAARSAFTDAELAALALLVMKWSHQKVNVALRIEPPIDREGLTEVTFTADGRTVLGRRLD